MTLAMELRAPDAQHTTTGFPRSISEARFVNLYECFRLLDAHMALGYLPALVKGGRGEMNDVGHGFLLNNHRII